jgi:hypothetical protein
VSTVAPDTTPSDTTPADTTPADTTPADTTPADTTPLGPLWLSHHYACDVDRCVTVGGAHVCRRCLAMFAGFFPALALLLSSWRDDLQIGDFGLVLGLAAFAGVEFVQVVRRRAPYSARRVLFLSPAVGAVLAWAGTTGVRDGLGPAHGILGVAALAVLAVLFANGSVLRRVPVAG